MCGIAACAGQRDLGPAVKALGHRGPDGDGITAAAGCTLGHTRLAIRDPRPRSAQPYADGPVTVAYNGELFNTAEVRKLIKAKDPGRSWRTSGDTETVAAALAALPAGEALAAFDGMFALAWADTRQPGVLHVARDRMGEIPLHLHRAGVAVSELKALAPLGLRAGRDVIDVAPGQHWQVTAAAAMTCRTFAQVQAIPAASPGREDAARRLRAALARAVRRRLVADVPVCTLLSGGIDSAVITAELARHVTGLVAYTAVLDPASADLRAARVTAEALGVELREIPVPVPDADGLAGVVAAIEQPYKAQVEIGWACLRLAAAIAADGYKVTYTGEASDELWASYGFGYHAIAARGWHAARLALVQAQARRNFPRVNKAFMTAGVEARLPFCDPDVAALALSLPQHAVTDGRSRPKAVLQDAYAGTLPALITRRAKVAFQDGLGLKQAIARQLPDPRRFYRAEYARRYG